MSKKPDSDASESQESGKRFLRRGKSKRQEDKVTKRLKQISSIQALRDAALTGDNDTQLLALCKLGEFGRDSYESMEIAFLDDNPQVRVAAAGMLAFTRRLDAVPILEQHATDDSETVREAIRFALEWLSRYGEESPESPYVPITNETPMGSLNHAEAIPLKTTDDVLVINDYTVTPETLEYGVTIKNEDESAIHQVRVTVLSFPSECLTQVDDLTQIIEEIRPGDSGSLIFGFEIQGEYVEGEIITSVCLIDSTEEEVAAKAGNVFVRSIYNQFDPFELGADEFIGMKSDLAQWNREHTVGMGASNIYKELHRLMESKNLYIFQNEDMERENAFMGVIAGIAKSRFSENRLAVNLTIVGNTGEDISKLRIDVFSDNTEIVHSAASDLYETILRELDIVDLNGE